MMLAFNRDRVTRDIDAVGAPRRRFSRKHGPWPGLRSVSEVWAICDEVWGAGMIREDLRLLASDDLRERGLAP